MKRLRINLEVIEQSLENLFSLPFPVSSASPLFDPSVKLLSELDLANEYDLVKLLYYSELFHIFRLDNPIRNLVKKHINDSLQAIFALGKYAFCYFLIRWALRLTQEPSPVYLQMVDRLGYSETQRDRLLKRILEDELFKRDWTYFTHVLPPQITFKDPTLEDQDEMLDHKIAEDNESADLFVVIKFVDMVLYNPDFFEFEDVPVDLSLLLELMIEIGKFDRAMAIVRHESILTDPVHLFIRIIGVHPTDPIAIFRAMELCVTAAPAAEMEIRAICVRALLNILKQKISDSSPTAENPTPKFISEMVILEETVEFPIPETRGDCFDFAVILGIAVAAADYVNMLNFCNGKSNLIASTLRVAIRDLLRILWFVRWRYTAMNETQEKGYPGDATLRLLSFPEFINQESARQAIQMLGPELFTDDLYALYMNGHDVFERDPEFVDFACTCLARISPRLQARMQEAVALLAPATEDMEESHLLLSVLVSHLVPWLRGAIPRAVVEFPCPEVVPNRLLDFEQFDLPEKPKPPPVMETKPAIHVTPPQAPAPADTPIIEEEEEEEMPEPRLKPPAVELPPQIPVPEPDHELSDGEEPAIKPPSRPRSPPSHKRKSAPTQERRQLRLINVDRSRRTFVPSPIQYPGPISRQQEFAPGYLFDPLVPHPPLVAVFGATPAPWPIASYGPIWDIDPSLYQRPYPRPPPVLSMEAPRPEPPVEAAQPIPSPGKVTKIEFVKPKPKKDPLESSGSIDGDFAFQTPPVRDGRPIDPFPLDHELRRRVDDLLAEEVPFKSKFLPNFPVYKKQTFLTEQSLDMSIKRRVSHRG
jgi:hypothetical protein